MKTEEYHILNYLKHLHLFLTFSNKKDKLQMNLEEVEKELFNWKEKKKLLMI